MLLDCFTPCPHHLPSTSQTQDGDPPRPHGVPPISLSHILALSHAYSGPKSRPVAASYAVYFRLPSTQQQFPLPPRRLRFMSKSDRIHNLIKTLRVPSLVLPRGPPFEGIEEPPWPDAKKHTLSSLRPQSSLRELWLQRSSPLIHQIQPALESSNACWNSTPVLFYFIFLTPSPLLPVFAISMSRHFDI